MQRYLTAILLCCFSLLASAEEKKEENNHVAPIYVKTHVAVNCTQDEDSISSVLKEYNEKPVLTGNITHDENTDLNRMVLFVNSKTGTWTMIEQIGPFMCVVGMGDELQAFRPKSGGKKINM